ncbi:MAG: hypothetical protein JWM78_1834, partial [Verrucomicrobiaceae bacterium]|nr:hypothetical protein [Verrucomicrobiaceae bacterium]
AMAAKTLAEQLGHRGFETDFANSFVGAELAARTKYYRTIIVVIEPDSSNGWDDLSSLRKRVLGSWIIVATSRYHNDDAYDKISRLGGDSLLAAPFSVEDLTMRLSAFSLRSRPVQGKGSIAR